MPKRTPMIDRLLKKVVEDEHGCWLFMGVRSQGYGQITLPGIPRKAYAHRVSYEFFIADIPAGLELDHLCRVRECCNPWHLEPVDHATNVHRGAHGLTTHCPQGHEYDEANTAFKRGTRQRGCRECSRTRSREYQRRKREAHSK
jgi:hypothetical protein